MEYLILWLISVGSTLTYTAYIWRKFGMTHSISASFYKLKNTMWFTLFIWTMVIPLMIVANNVIFWFAGVLIAFIGASADYLRHRTEYLVHMIGSIGGIILSYIALAFGFNMWFISIPLLVIIALIYFEKIKIKNYIWWIELGTIWLLQLIILLKNVL